jgi:hypothetical protein
MVMYSRQSSAKSLILVCGDILSAMSYTAEELSRRLDMRQTINLLILDFSKAFDTVPQRRLLHKIQHYGVPFLNTAVTFANCQSNGT